MSIIYDHAKGKHIDTDNEDMPEENTTIDKTSFDKDCERAEKFQDENPKPVETLKFNKPKHNTIFNQQKREKTKWQCNHFDYTCHDEERNGVDAAIYYCKKCNFQFGEIERREIEKYRAKFKKPKEKLDLTIKDYMTYSKEELENWLEHPEEIETGRDGGAHDELLNYHIACIEKAIELK